MVEIRPFHGLRYDPSQVKDLGRVVAPPYDVISDDAQAALYEASPYNVVRLEYPQGPQAERYETAAGTLRSWRDAGILQRDSAASLYLARHSFPFNGRIYQRYELTAAVRLEPWSDGAVLPHEHTAEKAKQDRLAMMQACRANLSPIMALYGDPDGRVARVLHAVAGTPSLERFESIDGDGYELWAITDLEQITIVRAAIQESIYIADGHHRYETALLYREEAPALSSTEPRAADYIMTSLTALDDPGLLSLPYHRLLQGLSEEAKQRFQRQADVYFQSEEIDIGNQTSEEVAALFESRIDHGAGPLIGLLERDSSSLRLLRLPDPELVTGLLSERVEAWARLSPCLFADVLLQPTLGVRQQEAEARGWLTYTRDTAEAVNSVRNNESDIVCLLDGVPLQTMTEIAHSGARLPHKSTYFHPKLATGLVVNPLDGTLEDE